MSENNYERLTLEKHCEQLAERNAKLVAALDQTVNWLRGQANTEREPLAKAAFVEAHNAVLSIKREALANQQSTEKP